MTQVHSYPVDRDEDFTAAEAFLQMRELAQERGCAIKDLPPQVVSARQRLFTMSMLTVVKRGCGQKEAWSMGGVFNSNCGLGGLSVTCSAIPIG